MAEQYNAMAKHAANHASRIGGPSAAMEGQYCVMANAANHASRIMGINANAPVAAAPEKSDATARIVSLIAIQILLHPITANHAAMEEKSDAMA